MRWRDMLYATRPVDPPVFAAVAAMLMLVAALACIIPARRAWTRRRQTE